MTPPNRAPRDDYASIAKQRYRHEVWTAIADHLGGLVATTHALILPYKHGAEIPILLDLGFQEEHIHAVDSNPALLASAPWRKQFPRVSVYGNELPRAMERIAAKGIRLGAANLDLCGNFSTSMVDTMRRSAHVGALADPCVVAITCLKGRESEAAIAALRLLNDHIGAAAMACDIRLQSLAMELGRPEKRTVNLLHRGQYKAGASPMAWACFSFTRPDGEPWEREIYTTGTGACRVRVLLRQGGCGMMATLVFREPRPNGSMRLRRLPVGSVSFAEQQEAARQLAHCLEFDGERTWRMINHNERPRRWAGLRGVYDSIRRSRNGSKGHLGWGKGASAGAAALAMSEVA